MSPRDYALVAQEAYIAAPDIGVASSASRAIVRQTADGLVIAFRGSDDEDSWLTDFDIDLVDVDGAGRLHKGFWNAWQAIASEVEAVTASQPVTFVGHSLGAALAVVAAVAFKLAGKPVAAVYGFEPPRVTPDLGVRTLLQDVPVHLYRNGLDVVTDVPVDWQHAALLIHIGTPELPFVNTLDHDLNRVINALT
jgi:triacylglycerol lipase